MEKNEILNNIVSRLCSDVKEYSRDIPANTIKLPFLENRFNLEQWHLYQNNQALVIRDNKEIIGYFQFRGPQEVSTRFNESEIVGLYGYSAEMEDYFSNQINVENKPFGQAIYVRPDYSEKFSGIAKTMITAACEYMIEQLRKDHYEVSKEKMTSFREKPLREIPFLMIKRCHTGIFQKYYQAKSTQYDYEDQDVAVYLHVKPPKFEIVKKNGC